jgi:hypothetical protein
MKEVKLLAYYLPQFHPTKENDTWWGKGFTEWTNVTKAKRFFIGHHQPKLPTDLGFYDLRLIEVMEAQAELANQYGIDGFVFYHYWFGNGKVMLDFPLQQFLKSPKVNITFCLCWANESWKGTWHGAGNKMLIEQFYFGEEDYINHFNYLLPFLKDSRHLTIDSKPVLQVYMPQSIPDLNLFVNVFQREAKKNGFSGIYFMSVRAPIGWNPMHYGFDGSVFNNLININKYQMKSFKGSLLRMVLNNPIFRNIFKMPKTIFYDNVRTCLEDFPKANFDLFPLAIPNWDNTPRTKENGTVYLGDTPKSFEKHLIKCINKINNLDSSVDIVFIKSWNEWAEGNILEPDMKYGHAFLRAVSNAKKKLI